VYLRAQSKAVTRKLLQKTDTFRHGMTGRRYDVILQFSRGTADRKHGNTSGPLGERVVHHRLHTDSTTHSSSTQTPTSWTDCWEVCCLKVTVYPSLAQQNRL